jgi:ParB family chromosome partitioning protein
MTTTPKRRALGRGLSALLPAPPAAPAADPQPAADRALPITPLASRRLTVAGPRGERDYLQVPIEEVFPSPGQPRKRFDDQGLDELAASIRAHGIIQPLIVRVRPEADGGGFLLIAGERRWRAAQRAGLREVRVVVQDVDSTEAFEQALVENLQRADLNPIEEAGAYNRLVNEQGYTQEQVAARVGKERSTIANSLRLLRLPPSVREMVEDGRLSMGHARALLGLPSPAEMETVARTVIAKSLSVRATEQLVRKRLRAEPKDDPAAASPPPPRKSAAVRDLEERLTKSLGAAVALTEEAKGKGGVIEIRYQDLDDLDRLLARLLGSH